MTIAVRRRGVGTMIGRVLWLVAVWSIAASTVVTAQDDDADAWYGELPLECGGQRSSPLWVADDEVPSGYFGGETVNRAHAVIVNDDTELFVVTALNGGEAVVEGLKMCVGIIAVAAVGEVPSGDLVEPTDGAPVPGEVMASSELDPGPFQGDDIVFQLAPLGYFGDPFDGEPGASDEDATAAEQALSVLLDAPMPSTEWVSQIEAAIDQQVIDGTFTALLDPEWQEGSDPLNDALPATSDYVVDFQIDPPISPGQAHGWVADGLTVYGNVAVSSDGSVSGALNLYGAAVDNRNTFSHSRSPKSSYVLRVKGLVGTPVYTITGAAWAKDY
jgi:hypothetical protein